MDRVKFVDHRGIEILFSNLAGIQTTAELQRALYLGSELVQSRPAKSVLVLVDLTGVAYNIESVAVLQQSVAANRRYVRARAVLGMPKIASIPFDIASKLADGPMARFEDMEAAKDWLVSQRAR